MTGYTVSGVSEGHGLRRKPMGTARRLQATVAVLAVLMLFASLLAIVQRSDFVESVANAPTRALVNPADTLTSADAALLEQLARVGNGITLEGASSSIDGRFMLSGAAFETVSGSEFSVVTSSWMGAELTTAVEPVLEGDRVLYQHEGFTEWWIRDGRSYEQGWTVDAPPANGTTDLTLDVVFEGAATTQLSPTTIELILGDGSRAWYRNLHAFDAEGTTLPAYMTSQGSRVTVTVEAEGAVYPVTIDPILSQDQQLLPPDSSTGDVFGEAIATDGDLLIVSVRGADRNVADQGRVEIYEWNGTGYDFVDELIGPLAEDTDFGWDVDINETAGHAVVGAPGDDSNGTDAGAAHIFVDNNDGTWGLKQTIYACDSTARPCGDSVEGGFDGDVFGTAVAISEQNSVLVGSPGANSGAGTASVYNPIGGGGEWLTAVGDTIVNAGVAAGDAWGTAVDIVAVDGGDHYAVIGAPGQDHTGFTDTGRVWLAGTTTGVWAVTDSDNGSGGGEGLNYGASVAIGVATDNSVIVVGGAPTRSRQDPEDSGPGRAQVTTVTGAAGAESLGAVVFGNLNPVIAVDTGFGHSVAFDEATDRVIIGSPFDDGAGSPEPGFVEVFQYLTASNSMDGVGGAAALAQPTDWPTATGNDNYGFAVAAAPSGNYVAGSPGWVQTAPRRSPEAGRVTTAGPGLTSAFTTVEVVNASAHDKLGWAVAISGDRMAASAIGDDERSSQNGLVYTYERTGPGASWTLEQLIVDPSPTDEVKPFGYSLDLEGDYLAIGSPGGDGEVAIYFHDGGAWAYVDSILGDAATFNATSGDFGFGTDVAISADGDWVAVTAPSADNTGSVCADCGGVFIYNRPGGVAPYVNVYSNTNPAEITQLGHSIDLDEVPGEADVLRVVAGQSGSSSGVVAYNIDTANVIISVEGVTALSLDARSLALDGSRMIVGDSDATSSVVIGDYPSLGEAFTFRALTGVLIGGTSPSPAPNGFVDVSGETAVVGRFGPGGGEVGVFYNDPAHGWGIADATLGWAPGPVDQLIPSIQQASHRIGRAVAIDGAGADKTVAYGADGRDTNGVDAGVVYVNNISETATTVPDNKVTTGSFASNRFGQRISMRDGAVPAALVTEQNDGASVHYMQLVAGTWSISETFTYATAVEDVDITDDGRAAVLLRDGTVIMYQEVCVGLTCSLGATGTTGTGGAQPGSTVSISADLVNVAASNPNSGDVFSSVFFADGSNAPTGAPAGVLASHDFGADMDSFGDLTVIGAPGTDGLAAADSGAVYLYDTLGSSYLLTIDSPVAGARFGTSVAIDQNRIVVGAPSVNTDGSFDGVVYVYEYETAPFSATLVATLEPTAGSGLSGWGTSVDIDGDSLVIGGTGYEESGIAFRDGSAVAFGYDGTNWVETDRFDHTDDANGDQAGSAVAIIGTDVLVGAPGDDNSFGQDAGAVYAYTATAVDVGPANRLLATSATSSAFGRHIDIDGSVAVITEHDGGAMQIYDLVGSDWVFRQRIDGFADSVRDVSIDGTRIAVIDRIGNELFLFEESGGTFSQVNSRSYGGTGVPESVVLDGDDIFIGLSNSVNGEPLKHELWAGGNVTVPVLPDDANGDETGWSIAKDGNLVFVGAPRWDSAAQAQAGRVYIYDTATQTWTGTIEADQAGNLFGRDLSASNGRLAIGYEGGEGPDVNAPNPTDDTGIVEVYNNLTTTGADLEQVVSGSNQDTADGFGRKVALDGDIMAVGAPAMSYDGARRGQVVMFAFDGTSFVEAETFQSGTDSTGLDSFGHDVAISGLNVIAGAFRHDNSRGSDAGAAYFFTSAGVPVVDNPALSFSLDLGAGNTGSVTVAAAGIEVSAFDAELLEDASDDASSIAAAPFASTNVEGTTLTDIPISSLPISSLAQDSNSILSTIPLVELGLDFAGGWPGLFEASGSTLDEVPINNLTLADVFRTGEPAGSTLASLPISSLDVEGTPISSLPISSLYLGSIPLQDLSASVDWCGILSGFIDGTCDDTSLTLFEASISGVPISSLPISSLPISSLPISSLPISSLPISSLDVEASPISSLPISSLPISSLPISSLPISSLDPAGLPISSLPISSLDLEGLPISSLPISSLELAESPISSLPISSLPISSLDTAALPISSLKLRNVPISSLPISSLPISSLPISSLPISSLFVADAPISSLPISSLSGYTDWCSYLADLDVGFDCSFAASESDFLNNTSIVDLGLRGVPISSLPISSLPISSLPISSLPISSLPISSLPISSLPISSLPISSLGLAGTPISSLGTVGATTLAEIPISSLDVAGSPISSLPISSLPISSLPISSLPISSLPISSLPISSLPISSLVLGGTPISSLPISSLDLADTPISSLPISSLSETIAVDCDLVDCDLDTLGEAVLAGALDATAVTIDDLRPYLGNIRLSDVANHFTGFSEEDVLDALAADTATLEQLLGYAGMTLGELPLSEALVASLLLGDLEEALWSVRLSDLVGAIIDPDTGAAFPDGDVESVLTSFRDNLPAGVEFITDLEYFGDVTLGDIIDGESAFSYGDLGPILELVHVSDLTDLVYPAGNLGDLNDVELGGLTLADLLGFAENDAMTLQQLIEGGQASNALFGFDMADLLLMLLGLDAVPFSDISFTEVETGALPPSVVPPLTFSAPFEVSGTSLARSVEIVVQIPGTATYLPGSATLDVAGESEPLEPVVAGSLLVWTVEQVAPNTPYTLDFDVTPTVTLGSTSLDATGRIVGTDVSVASFNAVSVQEPLESNDFGLPNRDADTTDVDEAVDTLYLTYISSETDNDVFAVEVQSGDELAIQLSSLEVDLDFAVYGRPTDTAVGAALSGASDEAPLSPITNPDQQETEAEPVNDFRRLDEEDPTLEFIGVSNSSGTETELLVTDPLPAGTYFIQVYGANGATNIEPAALQVQILGAEARPNCAAVGAGTITAGAGIDQAGPADANTVFLVNQRRMEHYYGQAGLDTIDAVKDFATYLNGANGPAGVSASVISVDGNGAIRTAYDAWDADGECSPESVNGVVSAINDVLDPLRGDLEHIVVVGGDPIIPMARLLDATEIANEYDFRHEFIGDNLVGGNAGDINALSASFWDRVYLSDEPYGETAARDLGNRFLYVSDAAIGRLVETPAEIQGMLSHFENFDGELDAQTAAVLGYDFLVDSSEQISADLVAAGLTVDDELADGLDAGGDKWDRVDAENKVVPAGGADDLISLNGHFDHYRALPADGDQVPNFTNNFLSDTVLNAAPGLLDGSIIFSMGCHGGLSVSDLQIGDGTDNTNGDWAQTFAADQAIFLGNTGFGYGDTEAVAYTEALLARFAELAVRPTDLGGGQQTTIGQALTFAKNDYASDLSVFSVYDEKALMEMTFYGLPFYTVDLTTVDAAPIPDNTTSPDATGLASVGVNADATNTLDDTNDRGDFYSNPDENGDPQTIVTPGRPIQPSLSTDVSVVDPADTATLESIAHGAVILGMDSTYVAPIDPVIAAVVFNESDDAPEPPIGDVVFPAKPVTINTATTPGGQRQSLVLATGQFDSEGSTQRLDDNINAIVYYSDPAETDFDAPIVGVVESNFDPGSDQLTITLSATDTANDVVRIYVLAAADPGAGSLTWTGLDLVQTAGTDEWSGSLNLPGSEVEFLIQAVDSAGNVGFATNKARNFNDDGTEEPEPPSPDLTVTVPAAGTAEGWYTGPVAVTVDSGDLAATYEISPGTASTDVLNGGFTIDGQGTFEWTVTRADGQTKSGTVEIDSTAPSATLAPPEDGAAYEVSQVPSVGFLCTDPSLQTCTASVTGPAGTATLALGDALPTDLGAYTVSVTATDVFGNQASDSASYTVVADPLDDLVVTVSPANLDVGSGLYTGDVDVTVESGDADTEYTLNGGTPVTIAAPGGTFTITAEEVTEYVVTRPADGATDDGSVEIDTTAPTATLIAPADGAVFTPGNVPVIDFDCTDRNPGTCEATVDGTPVALGDALPDAAGTYTIEVTATDAVDLETTVSGSYTVEVVAGDPIVVTDIEIDSVEQQGELVDIWGSFTGGVAPFTIAVDWGDGSTCADGTCAIEAPTVDEDGMFDASYAYDNGGEQTVTVTITDAAGTSIVETLSTATCTIVGTSGRDVLRGTSGDDVICGLGGNDRLYGRGGNDIIFGGSGRDRIYGQNGDDQLFGGRGNDIIYGSFGNDVLSGGRGVDTLIAGDGDDVLKGRQDNDWMYGQNGNDTLVGNRGNDRMFGGSGVDVMDGSRGNDRMYGQAGNDLMDAGNGNDLMYGGNGDDTMNGQNGDDNVNGGRGDDVIDGGGGSDRCRGNAGSDTLVGCET